jgi:hypothetical protein
MELRRDVKLKELLEVASDVARFFKRDMPGTVYKAGPIPEFGPA